MEVTIQIPDEVVGHLTNRDAVSRQVLEDFAAERYRAGDLSQRQVGKLLGLDFWATEAFLKQHEAYLDYNLEDLEADRAALAKILAEP
jgi:Uncharacterised protein family (UPF0175)